MTIRSYPLLDRRRAGLGKSSALTPAGAFFFLEVETAWENDVLG